MPDLAHFDQSTSASSLSRSRPAPRPLDLTLAERLDDSTDSQASGKMSVPASDFAAEVDSREQVAMESLGELDRVDTGLAGGEEARQELKQSQRTDGATGASRVPLDLPQPSTSSSHLSARSLPSSTAPSPQTNRSVLGYTSSTRSTTGSPYRRRQSVLGLGDGRRSEPVAPLALNGAGPSSASQSPAGTSSRFLLAVVPPGHLPHDPPHPRSNPSASGYGPPEHFRRGTLVPLYPTLSSQLAAIAREYGLPSSGGLVLYLLSTTDPSTQQPFPHAAGFAGEGGPRISETAWSMLWAQLFAEEEAERELALLRQQEAEMGYSDEEGEADYSDVPPPVPPIPVQHDQQAPPPRQGQTSESDNAIFSDENEPISQSSDAGASADGSVYSAATGAADGSVKGKQNASASRPSSLAQAGLGRGLPAALTSPNARFSKRFTSLPPNLPPRGQRHSSRHSVRSATNVLRNHRSSSYMHSGPPHSAGGLRSASYASSHFAPSIFSAGPSLPSYGASVVVGKIEFDIHASTRQGKWYEAWLASAAPAPFVPPPVPATGETREIKAVKAPEAEKTWQELHLPNLVAAKTPQLLEARGIGIVQDSSVPSPVARSVDEQTTPSTHARLSTTSTGDLVSPIVQQRNLESAESRFSFAGLAGSSPEPRSRPERGVEDENAERSVEESKQTPLVDSLELQPLQQHKDATLGDSSIVERDVDIEPERPADSRSPSSLLSCPASNASTQHEASERGTDDTPLLDREAEHAGYQALDDDDLPKADDAGSDSDDSRYGVPTTEDEQLDQHAVGVQDPLGDVFGSDEATWRSIAADEAVPRRDERDLIETTGLGMSGSHNLASLENSAPLGVVEHRPEDESLDERGLPPMQDDIADVQAMLSPSTPTAPTHLAHLASPIRLDSNKSESAVETPRETLQEAVVSAAASPPEEERAQTPPFLASHSSKTSISTINFTVRPPSTVASMSPEFVPQRKQRHGWTSIPPVVDPSISASSSLSSIAPLAEEDGEVSQRSSAAGLERNLDDLERALAELSPRAPQTSRVLSSPSTLLAQADEPQAGPSLLASRRAFRYGAPASPDFSSSPHFDFEQAQTVAAQLGVLPVPAPASGLPDEPRTETLAAPATERPRIPRSSSLHKPAGHPQPHLVALPPSPMPETIAAFASPSPEPEEAAVPTLPSASPSWPAPPALPLLPGPASMVPMSFADIVPPPPPVKEETSASQPRSPGPLKSLRNAKWGSRSKSIDAGKAGVPADETEESSGSKSPLGAFFGKFGRIKSRKSDPTSPEPPLPVQPYDAMSPASAVEPLHAEHVQQPPLHPPRKQSLDVARPRRPSVSGSLPRDFAADEPVPPFPPSLAAGVSTAPQLPPFPPSEEATMDSWNAAVVGSPSAAIVPSEAKPLLDETRAETRSQPVAPQPIDAAHAYAASPPVVESASSDFSALAFPAGSLPATAPATPRSPPSASSSANDSPATGEVVSPSSFPQPPTTPRYPASAPVTPAGWPLATPRTRSGGKRRLSADIDQLLSQMNDIEFGLGDEDATVMADPAVPAVPLSSEAVSPMPIYSNPGPEVATPRSVAPPAPRLVEPEPDAALAYAGESTSPTIPPIALPSFGANATTASGGGFLGVQQSLDRPLSEDLRALGSMMTGLVASPPTSPPSKTTGLTTSDSAYLDYIVTSSPPATNAAVASA